MQRTQIIIVRHGQTEWNIKGIRQGNLDSALTENGIAQAKALALRLAREKFSALYSSDLGRAVQTAEEIAALTGHEIVTDARLRERHLGIFQGLNGDEIVHSLLDMMYAKRAYTTIQRAVHIHPTVTELIPTLLGDLKPLE